MHSNACENINYIATVNSSVRNENKLSLVKYNYRESDFSVAPVDRVMHE